MISFEQVLTALGGAFIGGLIAQIGHLLQAGRENRKVLNMVLHAQLDVWFSISRSDPSAIINALAQALAKRLPAKPEEIKQFYVRTGLTETLSELLPQLLPADLEARYALAVERLAEVDPLLAYRLSGRTMLARYITSWHPHFDRWVRTWMTDPLPIQQFQATESVVNADIRTSVLDTIEGDIRRVAYALGLRTWWQARKTLRKGRLAVNTLDEGEIDAMLEKVFRALEIPPDVLSPAPVVEKKRPPVE